jgi:N-acetyl-gamma-glutamyl-phosphate reductase
MSTQSTIKTAIVGASGYSGEELVRLLLKHPRVELSAITSRQYAGQSLAQVFPKFAHYPQAKGLRFSEPNPSLLAQQADFIILALPHGVAAEIAVPLLRAGCRVIDLSADFRLKSPTVYEEFYGHPHPAPDLLAQSVYGLPEVYRQDILPAKLVASPGCYPTSILLPILPLLRAKLIDPDEIIADSLSGVSGAGRKTELEYLFVECNESARPYAVPKHRHLSEIEQELGRAVDRSINIQFTPHLVPVNRGMLTTLYLRPRKDALPSTSVAKVKTGDPAPQPAADKGFQKNTAESMIALNEQITACYQAAYGQEAFVRLLAGKALPDTKNVTGTNVIEIAWRLDPRTGRLVVMSALDNLVKGASGQAVQSLNLMAGLPETDGLL